jgi:CRP-like cAMP-binding protein
MDRDSSDVASSRPGTLPRSSAIERALLQLMALTDGGRAHLANLVANAFELKPRRKLIDRCRPSEHFFIVVSGWLVDYRQLRNGRRQILNFRLPGELIGIECLIYRDALYSTASLTHCSVAPVSREAFEQVQILFPRLASAFLLTSMRDAAILQQRAVNLGRRPAFQRVAHLLLELEQRLRTSENHDRKRVPFPLSQQDIADCVGITPQYVNRVLQQMRRMRLIRLDDGSLEILDSAELQSVGRFTPDYLTTERQTTWQRRFTLPVPPANDMPLSAVPPLVLTPGKPH